MIPAKTRYKTHDGKLLAIVQAFKTWGHYLKRCKHEVFFLTDHNHFWLFMDTKSLSFSHVRLAQKLCRYHFQIDYWQKKANGATDAISRFAQQNNKKKANLWSENIQIFHCLQFLLTNASISRSQHHVFGLFAPPPGPHLRNLRSVTALAFLKYRPNRARRWTTL